MVVAFGLPFRLQENLLHHLHDAMTRITPDHRISIYFLLLRGPPTRGNFSGSFSFATQWLLLSALESLNFVKSAAVGALTLQPSSAK
jgi:hypothetical protein